MLVSINEIKVNPSRRDAEPEDIKSLADSITELGLLNPIKDEPHIFEAALHFLGTEKAETIVFDDALYAIRTAKEAGFPVAAVYDSHEKAHTEIHALSDFYLENLVQFDLI